MRIQGDLQTSVYLSGGLKRRLKAEAALEGRDMTETAAEAIALYVLIDDEVRKALEKDTKGEVISDAVDYYVREQGVVE
jgi:hypothetical protein